VNLSTLISPRGVQILTVVRGYFFSSFLCYLQTWQLLIISFTGTNFVVIPGMNTRFLLRRNSAFTAITEVWTNLENKLFTATDRLFKSKRYRTVYQILNISVELQILKQAQSYHIFHPLSALSILTAKSCLHRTTLTFLIKRNLFLWIALNYLNYQCVFRREVASNRG
jgi:hypothetical protein